MGDEAYQRQVGDKLTAERRVVSECDEERLSTLTGAQCWRVDGADCDIAAEAGEEAEVYSQLAPSDFLTSSFPCDDAQWLFACYDGLLLDPSARFVPSAHLVMNMPNALRSEQQVESVYRAWKSLPSLVHLRLDWHVSDEDSDAFVCQPRHHCLSKRDSIEDRSLDRFPSLRSLDMRHLYLNWRDSFLPILRHGGLLQLRLDGVTVLGAQQDWARYDLCFHYPARLSSVAQLLAIDSERASRKNRQLRRAVCSLVLSSLSSASQSAELQSVLAEVHATLTTLQAEQQADDTLATSDSDEGGSEAEKGDSYSPPQHYDARHSRLGAGHTSTASTLHPPTSLHSFTGHVLENKQMLELIATYLCYTAAPTEQRSSGVDNSLLAFGGCCRRAHALLTGDGPWWHRQQLDMTLHRPVVSRYAWTCVPSQSDSGQHSLALLARAFTGRQQEIARRVLGSEVYERQVGDKLKAERRVAFECDDGCFLRHVTHRCWHPDAEDDEMAAAASEEVEVYTELQPASFLSSASFPCDSVEWLFSCHESALLPPSVRYVRSARIVVQLPSALSTVQQEASKHRLLQRLPSLVHLRLEWDSDEDEPYVFQPEWRQKCMEAAERCGPSLLPGLRSLHMCDMFIAFIDHFWAILQYPTPLVQMRFERNSVVGWSSSPNHWSANDVSFSYPRRLRPVSELMQLDAAGATRLNRKLRRFLAGHILRRLQPVSEQPHLRSLLEQCENVQAELSASRQADDAVGWDGGSEQDEDEDADKAWEADDDEDEHEDEQGDDMSD